MTRTPIGAYIRIYHVIHKTFILPVWDHVPVRCASGDACLSDVGVRSVVFLPCIVSTFVRDRAKLKAPVHGRCGIARRIGCRSDITMARFMFGYEGKLDP